PAPGDPGLPAANSPPIARAGDPSQATARGPRWFPDLAGGGPATAGIPPPAGISHFPLPSPKWDGAYRRWRWSRPSPRAGHHGVALEYGPTLRCNPGRDSAHASPVRLPGHRNLRAPLESMLRRRTRPILSF